MCVVLSDAMKFTLTRPATPHTPLPASRAAFRRAKTASSISSMRWAILAYFVGFPVWVIISVILLQVQERLKGGVQAGLIEGTWVFLRGLVVNQTGLIVCMLALAFVFGFPIACRIGFDFHARKTSNESVILERRKARTMRRLWKWVWPTLLVATFAGLVVPS